MTKFQLTERLAAEACKLAQETWERNRDNPDYYYPNNLLTHQVGKLGEVSAECWIRESGHKLDAVFRDLTREGECDLMIGELRLEVKTWSIKHWEKSGRCVIPKQLPWIAKKADSILWVTIDRELEPPLAVIQGFNNVGEIRAYEPIHTPTLNILNHQVPLSDLRDPSTLLPPSQGNHD